VADWEERKVYQRALNIKSPSSFISNKKSYIAQEKDLCKVNGTLMRTSVASNYDKTRRK